MNFSFAMILTILCSFSSFQLHAEQQHLLAAFTDIAGKKICDRLQNRFRGLQGTNSEDQPSYNGTLWIHSCQAISDDKQPDNMTLELGIKGWRWLGRDKEKLAAEFNVSEFARFEVEVGLTGKVTASYDSNKKQLAFWFEPLSSPKVNFTGAGDVDVEKEGIWASVLSGAATLVGQSPDTMADEKLATKGEQRFTQRLSDGFSVSVDFCSGRVVSELGQLDQTALFAKLNEPRRAGFNKVDLHPATFLLFGPYGEHSELLDLQLKLDHPADFRNKLVCMKDAVSLAKAYMQGNDRTPEVPSIKLVKGDSKKGDDSLRNADQTCPVVAVFATDESVKRKTSLEFRVRDYSKNQPLMNCNVN